MEHKNKNFSVWENEIREFHHKYFENSQEHKTQALASSAITYYLSSCEHDWKWIPSIGEWREMLEISKSLIVSAGFVFDLRSCVWALSGWFWRYHWREIDRELFKQYAIAVAYHFDGDISAVINGVWDEVIETSESGDPAFESSPMLLIHLRNVSLIPGSGFFPQQTGPARKLTNLKGS